LKKLKIFNLINFLCLCVVISGVIVLHFNGVLNNLWYVFIVGYVALKTTIKYCFFHNESVLWFAIVLWLIFVYMLLCKWQIVSFKTWPLIGVFFAVASGVLWCIHKNRIHIIIAILSVFSFPPMLLDSYDIPAFWWVALIQATCSIVGIIITKNILKNYTG